MAIYFDNTADPENFTVPPVVVGTQRIIQLVKGSSVNVYRDGVLVAELINQLQTYKAEAQGTYTFVIRADCPKPVVIDVANLFNSIIGPVELEPDLLSCSGGDPIPTGDFSFQIAADQAENFGPPYPPVYNNAFDYISNGAREFPVQFSPPNTLTRVAAGFYATDSINDVESVACTDVTVTRITYEVQLLIETDTDPSPTDLGDAIYVVELGGSTVPVLTSSPDSGVVFNPVANGPDVLEFIISPVGQTSTLVFDVETPSDYSISQANDMRLGFTVQIGGVQTIVDVQKYLEYTVSDTCNEFALSVAECNSGAIASTLSQIEGNQQSEVYIGRFCYGAGSDQAYGQKDLETGGVRYFDIVTNVEVTDPVFSCPDAIVDVDINDEVTEPDGQTLSVANAPNAPTWDFSEVSVTSVKSFSVFNTSAAPVTVSFASGRSVIVEVNGTRTFGSSANSVVMDVSGVSLNFTSDGSSITWES